jgi:demethylmenaquinone methyltransferase/2-methoxy-6-polyprenyl-1,4-benzoquinol methylase
MDKNQIISFFDNLAGSWDAMQVRNEDVIRLILDKSQVQKGSDILDIACGTGVLFPDYLRREVNSITGIDISGEMIKTAKEKYPQVRLILGDAENYEFKDKYDVVMIYNAFPHFFNADKLIENLAGTLKPSGRITIAHGLSEKELEECHSGSASKVSVPLVKKEALADMLSPYFDVDILISDERMYMVSGVKK